jgi:hypothetical protein
MTESKKDPVATERNAIAAKAEMTLEQRRQLPNGSPLGFEAPVKLDYWFNSQLMQMYAEVVSEPLPNELLDLLEKFREKKKNTP